MATDSPSPTDESDPPAKRALDCHRRGLKCYRAGDLRGAAEWIGRAVELDATVPRYHNNLAVALRNLGRLAEAAEACRRALALEADYADAHTNLGHTLYDQGLPDDARTHFCRALELKPDHADALFGLGTLCFDRGETDEAIRRFRESLAVRPDHAATYNNLGNALHKAGKPGEAIAAYERAVALDPTLTAAAVQLARVYAQEGLIDEARQSFARLAERFPDDPVWRLHPLALCPTVFPSRACIDDYRASVEAGLRAVGDVSLTVNPDSVAANGVVPSFFFSHHGRNNRPLKEGFAALFEPVLGGPRPSGPAHTKVVCQ